MYKSFFALVLAIMFVNALWSMTAHAQLFKTFVSQSGADTNNCSFSSPCSSLQRAHNQVGSGGHIACLNSGEFGGVTLSKTVTIDCQGTAATTFQVIVNGSGIVVTIRHLTITSSGSDGLVFLNGAALVIENSVVRSHGSFGIRFIPSTHGSKLVIDETLVEECGVGSTGAGILIGPQNGGTAAVALSRMVVTQNVFGIVIDSTAGASGINAAISNSVISGNSQDGILAFGGAPIGVLVTNTKSVNNNIGIRSLGANVTVRVEGSKITGNGTGLNFNSGGSLLTTGNNFVEANAANGTFSGSVGLK